MKKLAIIITILMCSSVALAQSSTYDPFKPRQHTNYLGTPQSFQHHHYSPPPMQPFQRNQGNSIYLDPMPGGGYRVYDSYNNPMFSVPNSKSLYELND